MKQLKMPDQVVSVIEETRRVWSQSRLKQNSKIELRSLPLHFSARLDHVEIRWRGTQAYLLQSKFL